MKHLIEIVTEGNITNTERNYREFCHICKGYNVNPDDVEVQKTSKHNWTAWIGDKKVFIISGFILTDKTVEDYKIKVKE